jgi:Clp amino terminal domain, pathogenicity island component
MFERYTEKARRTIFFARYEASQFGSPYIETEHLLLGLLREEKALIAQVLPNLNGESIRNDVVSRSPKLPTTATSVDLPLSNESKRVLAYAAEEAERLGDKHIGNEHLLLGMLREHNAFAAVLLVKQGADVAGIRRRIAKLPDRPNPPRIYNVRGFARGAIATTIEIHGVSQDIENVREAVKRCRAINWLWQKRDWSDRDIVVENKTGCISFDLSLAADSSDYKLIEAGWKKDRCMICNWELFESKDDSSHGSGYTNGRDWLCTECYEKFMGPSDFFLSNHPEIT